MFSKDSKHSLTIISILLIFLLALSGCSNSNYHVALYKDNTATKEAILVLFPSENLDIAMQNCEATVELYQADDRAKNIVSLITNSAPIYYCLEFEDKV